MLMEIFYYLLKFPALDLFSFSGWCLQLYAHVISFFHQQQVRCYNFGVYRWGGGGVKEQVQGQCASSISQLPQLNKILASLLNFVSSHNKTSVIGEGSLIGGESLCCHIIELCTSTKRWMQKKNLEHNEFTSGAPFAIEQLDSDQYYQHLKSKKK